MDEIFWGKDAVGEEIEAGDCVVYFRDQSGFNTGEVPLGTVKFNFDGKTQYHGQYDSIEEACHVAEAVWRSNALKVASRYDLDARVYEAISKMTY